MKIILFICQANVGRSQMAEGFYNARARTSRAISGGVVDKGEKYGYKPAPAIVTAMQEDRIDISQQTVKLVTRKMIEQADKVIVLCKQEEVAPELIDNPEKFQFKEIEDPYEQGVDVVKRVREQIKTIVTELIAKEEEVA